MAPQGEPETSATYASLILGLTMLSRVFPVIRLFDAPNTLTAANAALGVLAMCLSRDGHVELGAALIVLAALLDYLDGHLARTYFGDQIEHRAFGKQLDTLADLLNFSVAPAVIISETFTDTPFNRPICVALILSSVLRLALFNVLPERKKPGYIGIPTTYTGFILANALFLQASQHLSEGAVLSVVALFAVLQVLSIPVRKIPAKTVIPLMVAIFAMAVVYAKFS
ncbi:CDP-alcohol phosphatidyltransferase family protein [Burkholderia ubonensis]|uniref:CDP-alcohol phosphatidyltransferase family protein n=1 Tax=Burkholderia ubonensis TaxID=101571 RepID=UPI0012F9FACC|nr:CDP-alcohol phosphatidyltransferase family protein [Burkholderia ubonensis]